MITLTLLCILILIIIWTAYTYLDYEFIKKYKDISDLVFFMIIESSLYYFTIPLWSCITIAIPCILIGVYNLYKPSRNILQVTLSVFADNFIFCVIPYAISILMGYSSSESDGITALATTLIAIAFCSFLFISKKIRKNNKHSKRQDCNE